MAPQPTAPLTAQAEVSDPFEGTSYRMIRKLARGGMGQVYVVEHRELGRECVAKVVHQKFAKEPQLLERVRIEAESLGSLNHPNIVSVNNFGVTKDQRPFIVMELLRGEDLARALASGCTFTIAESVEIVLQACSALGAAHGIGIVHRDVRPANLFLHHDVDGTVCVKLLDFGVARVIPGVSPETPTPLPQPTATGIIVGTLNYASPEGVAGQRVDYRADIYSLGLVLYRLLAGRGPFSDNLSETGLITTCLLEEPKPPSFYASGAVRPELDAVVLKALQKSPDERYATMRDFAAALEALKPLLDADTQGERRAQAEYTPRASSSEPPLAAAIVGKNGSKRRALLVNGLLFMVILVVTTAIVGIVVSRMKHDYNGAMSLSIAMPIAQTEVC